MMVAQQSDNVRSAVHHIANALIDTASSSPSADYYRLAMSQPKSAQIQATHDLTRSDTFNSVLA